MYQGSKRVIEPGKGKKDAWWGGEDTMKQALAHLEEALELQRIKGYPIRLYDVYDNSSGHNCMAADALNAGELNLLPQEKIHLS